MSYFTGKWQIGSVGIISTLLTPELAGSAARLSTSTEHTPHKSSRRQSSAC